MFFWLIFIIGTIIHHNQGQDVLKAYIADESDILVSKSNVLMTVDYDYYTLYKINFTSLAWFNSK